MLLALTGGTSIEAKAEYPDDWDQRRRNVYRRDDYTCQNCGIRGGRHGNAELHAHHIVPKAKGGVHDESNLVTVCDGCHDAIHKPYKFAPTAFIEGAEAEIPSLWGSWWIHIALLIFTLGAGNVLYIWWRWKKRKKWKAARER